MGAATAVRAPVAPWVSRALVLLLAVASQAVAQADARKTLPTRLTDSAYWALISDMSEPDGYFRSENLLSNERGYQYVIPRLIGTPQRLNQVYMGVGPEQNFTYLAALKPKMAFIIDIRRGNLLEHLLYKALFELSADRAEFISRLFSKPRPRGLDSTTSADSLYNAYWYIETDSALYYRNVREVRQHLTETHKFPLTANDINRLLYVYDHFYFGGPAITYSYSIGGFGGRGGGNMPHYFELMAANDGTGLNRGFLGSEAAWRAVKDMHVKNLIVPVVGDFAGPKAVRAVGNYIREHGGVVTAIYGSNVEQYLFMDGKAWSYYENLGSVPVDSSSVFIRSRGGGRGMGFSGASGMQAPNVLNSVQDLLAAHKAGRINYYADIFGIGSR